MAQDDKALRPSIIDRVLAQFSPALGRDRFAARLAMQRMQDMARGYDGATMGRQTANWRSRNTSANSEIDMVGSVLRSRARDLVRNNPIAANGVQILVSNLVGTGIRPRAATKNASLNADVDRLWAEFSANCDFYGHTDFHGLTALAVRSMVEAGDSLVVQRVLRGAEARSGVPLRLDVREIDHLDATKIETTAPGGRRIINGIEYNREGRRVAYWLHPEHPGDTVRDLRNRYESVRLPADQVVHLFERQRTQDRGVTWLAPVMLSLRDLDDWQNAELVRKKTEACMVGVVLSDSDTNLVPKVHLGGDNGQEVQEFGPGMIAYASGADDIKFNQPVATGGVYEWHRVHLHILAAGLRMPYSLLTGDLSQANFASSRVGLNEFHRFIEMTQWNLIIPRFCQPVWDWFVTAAYLAGRIGVPRVAVEWAPPTFQSVNPKQDAEADLLEVRAGFVTLPQMIAKRGLDPVANLTEQAAFLKKAEAMGLSFDSDPARMTKAGTIQGAVGADAPDPEDEAGADDAERPPETN